MYPPTSGKKKRLRPEGREEGEGRVPTNRAHLRHLRPVLLIVGRHMLGLYRRPSDGISLKATCLPPKVADQPNSGMELHPAHSTSGAFRKTSGGGPQTVDAEPMRPQSSTVREENAAHLAGVLRRIGHEGKRL